MAKPPGNPRDLTAVEANSCLNSDDPAQHAVLKAHLDTLCDDLRAGKGLQIDSTAGLMAGIRARFGVPNLEEQERIRAFESRHYRCGGTIEIAFAMTGIGTGVRVSCTTCNETENVTDYDSW